MDLETELALDAGVAHLIANTKYKRENGKVRHRFKPDDARDLVNGILVASSAAIGDHRRWVEENKGKPN